MRAPIEAPMRHNDPASTVTSPHWLQWFQQSFDRLMVSFNGRFGTVVPEAGDYTAAQVGADAAGTAAAGDAAHLAAYDHDGYDSHVAATNANPHGTDHDMLDGLGDDDHEQYLLLAGRTGQRAAGPLIIGGVTDNATVEEDGTLVLNGNGTGFRDENFSGAASSIGPGAAALVNWDTSSILVPSFPHNLTKELQLIREYDHAGKVAASIIPHAHLFPSDANVGTAKFFLEYYIKNDGNAALTGTLNATLTTSGTAWEELRLNFSAITSVLLTQGTQIGMRLYRLSTDPGTYAHPVAVSTWGYHYEIDTPAGSRGITSK